MAGEGSGLTSGRGRAHSVRTMGVSTPPPLAGHANGNSNANPGNDPGTGRARV